MGKDIEESRNSLTEVPFLKVTPPPLTERLCARRPGILGRWLTLANILILIMQYAEQDVEGV